MVYLHLTDTADVDSRRVIKQMFQTPRLKEALSFGSFLAKSKPYLFWRSRGCVVYWFSVCKAPKSPNPVRLGSAWR